MSNTDPVPDLPDDTETRLRGYAEALGHWLVAAGMQAILHGHLGRALSEMIDGAKFGFRQEGREQAQRSALADDGMSEERLEEIANREAAAAPGPWEWSRTYELDGDFHWGLKQHGDPNHVLWPLVSEATDVLWGDQPDSLFLAAARQDVPDLLTENRRLRTLLAMLAADEPDLAGAVRQARQEGVRIGLRKAATVAVEYGAEGIDNSIAAGQFFAEYGTSSLADALLKLMITDTLEGKE